MNEKNKNVSDQKQPVLENNNIPVWDLVKKDIDDRNEAGIKKYGTALKAFNGRNSIIDSYQEALDLVVYFRQSIEERDVIVDFLKRIAKKGANISADDSMDAFVLLKQLGEL